MEQDILLYTDELTQVKNRRYINKLKKDIIPELRNNGLTYTIAIVDLDHFKEVNDTYGHLKGDEVIKEFALFLKNNLRKNDIIIRYGGDEFIVFQPELKNKNSRTIWQRIIEKMKNIKLADLSIGMSVGLASYPEDAEDFTELFKEADSRLYMAKKSGRGRIGEKESHKLHFESYSFVNRIEERDALKNGIEKGNIVFVKGPVGMGKTRLIRETLSGLRGREILWSACLPFNFSIPYYPIRELIKYKISRGNKDFLADIPIAYRVELGKIVPSIMENISEENVRSVGEMLDRYRLFEGIRKVLVHGQKPKVIIVDDIQWMDESSIEFFEYLILSNTPELSFIFASRIEEENPHATSLLRNIGRAKRVMEIQIQPLNPIYQKQMIENILGKCTEELIDYIVNKSAGNPFFIEELLKELYNNGYLILQGDTWHLVYPPMEVVPKTIEDVIVRKFNALSQEAQNVLKLSSVAGNIDIELLQSILKYNEGHIIGLIEDALKKKLLKEENEEIKFTDELTRDIIYSNYLGTIKKRFFHKEIAQQLEKQYKGKEEEICERLAFHFEESRIWDKCLKYSIKAGDKATKVYANYEALKFYKKALKCLEKLDHGTQETYLPLIIKKKIKVLSLIGEYEEAISNVKRLIEISERTNDKKELAMAYEFLCDIYTSLGNFTEELKTAQKVYTLYKELNNQPGIGEALNLIGIAYYNLSEFDKALSMFKESLNILEKVGNEDLLASIYNNMGAIYNEAFLQYEEARKYLEKALSLREKINDLVGMGSTLNNLGFLYDNKRDLEKSIKYYTESLELSRKIGDIEGEAIALLNIGVTYEEQDMFKKAIEYYEKALKIARDTGSTPIENIALNNIGVTYREMGEYKKSIEYTDMSLKLSERIHDKKGVVAAYRTLGDIYLDLGEFDKAEEYLNNALLLLKEVNDTESYAGCTLSLAEILMEKGKLNSALKMVGMLETEIKGIYLPDIEMDMLFLKTRIYVEQNEIAQAFKTFKDLENLSSTRPTYTFYKKIMYALILARQNDMDESQKLLEEGIEGLRKLGTNIILAKALYSAGKSLLGDDRSVAESYLQEAITILNKMGAEKRANKIKEILN